MTGAPDLQAALARLYAQEVNCGVRSVWDAGFVAWVGGLEPASATAVRRFDDLDAAARWLDAQARAHERGGP